MLPATTGGGKPGGGKRKHKMAVEVVDGTMRVVLPRVINDRRATVKDIQAAVQDRLRKRRKDEQDSYPLVTEIRERPKRSKVDTGLLLDDDEALSDLMDSDAEEGMTFIAVLNGEVGSAGGGSGAAAGPAASPPSAETNRSVSGAAAGAETGKDGGGVAPATIPSVTLAGGKSSPGPGKGKGKNKAGVPHKIPYTVAGLPRGGGGRRGPREGVVTTTVTSSLRDLKQAIAKDVGVSFTPDASPLSTSGQDDTRLKIKVTVAPNVTVEVKVGPSQTVRDLWRMVDRVARAADAARSESGKGDANRGSAGDDAGAEVVAAAAAAAAEDAYTTVPGGDDDDDNSSTGEGDQNAVAKDDFLLPRGQLLMRQAARSSGAPRNMFRPSQFLSEDGAGDFLCFPEDVLGTKGCRAGHNGCGLRDGNELILVGPGAITPDSTPAWAVHVLVLGQKVGCISIPNRRLAEEIGGAGEQRPQASTAASTTTTRKGAEEGGESGGKGPSKNGAAGKKGTDAKEQQQMRTLGDLRKLLSKELELDADRMDLWIAPPPQTDRTAGGSEEDAGNSAHKGLPGTGMVPEQPRGERASFDSMSLGHYGLDHGGVVDVRVRPTSWEAASGSGATGPAGAAARDEGAAGAGGGDADGVQGGTAAAAAAAAAAAGGEGEKEADIVRVVAKTNEMMLRGMDGVVLFLSKSSFGLPLLKRLATRALAVPLSLVIRCSFDKEHMHTFANSSVEKWLGRDVRSNSVLMVYVNTPTPAPRNQLGRSTGAVYQPPKGTGGDDSAPAASDSDSEDEFPDDPVRTSVALWVEEPNRDGADPLGVCGTSLSRLDATVYPLRSTFESDGAGLAKWGLLREGVRVFAVFYMTRSPLSASEAGKNRPSGREGAFGTSLCWHSRPVPPPSSDRSSDDDGDGGGSATTRDRRSKPKKPEEDDSEVGQACFLSCAYMLCDHVRKLQEMAYEGRRDYDGEDNRSLGWLLRELMALLSPRFPPAALALNQLAEAEDVTDAEGACLVQCLWGLAREMIPASVADESVLENSRAFLSWLVSRASSAHDDADKVLARELAIANRKKTASASAAADLETTAAVAEGEVDLGAEALTEVGSVSVYCCRLVDRLELGHAVLLRVNGELLEGAYSSGGAMEKKAELLGGEGTPVDDAGGDGGGGEGGGDGKKEGKKPKVEVVPWEAAGRLLLACPFEDKVPVLRYAHPKGNAGTASSTGAGDGDGSLAAGGSAAASDAGSDGVGEEEGEGGKASWLSLVDWSACVRRTGEQAFLRVVGPLSLGAAPCPSLTRDREGHLCVFTGKAACNPGGMELFTPLKGGDSTTDYVHALAQALGKLRASKGGIPGGEFEEAKAPARVARECVVVCMDTSYSMGGRPDFEDDKRKVMTDDEKKDLKKKLSFDWSARPAGKDDDDETQVVDLTSDGAEVISDGDDGDDTDENDEVMDLTSDGAEVISDGDGGDDTDENDEYGFHAEARRQRKQSLLTALLGHRALPQLQEVASHIHIRFGDWNENGIWGMMYYSEQVLEELILEDFDPNVPGDWTKANQDFEVYRLYRKEFMDVLLKRGKYKDGGPTSQEDDVSEWAPRQFLCPITQALMMDPVVAADGHSYERHAILEWFDKCKSSSRPPSSPMTGGTVTSTTVTTNHALKSRIQDWVKESNAKQEEEAGDASAGAQGGKGGKGKQGKGKGKGGKGKGKHPEEDSDDSKKKIVKIFVPDKSGGNVGFHIAIDRAPPRGIDRLKNAISRRRAWGMVSAENIASGGNGGASSGAAVAAGTTGGQRKSKRHRGSEARGGDGDGNSAGGGGASSSSSSSTTTPPSQISATVCPSKLHLVHKGRVLTSLWDLKNGDTVLAVEVMGPKAATYTVKLEDPGLQDVYLLTRSTETVFSLKLRFWVRHPSKRPSRQELWHGLKDVGDGVRSGSCLSNVCRPVDYMPGQYLAADAVNSQDPSKLCVLEVGSHNPFHRRKDHSRPSLTRLDAVKQLFHAYNNRVQAYDLPQEVGLISFGSKVDVACQPTALLENFRDEVDQLSHGGDTTLWDALSEACTLLEKWKRDWRHKAKERAAERRRKKKAAGGDKADSNPKKREEDPILRVVVLSDGEDTKSTTGAPAVCGRLQKAGVIVDSITVGRERNEVLKCVALATGGYAFHPKTLRAALRLNEQETVLSAAHRARLRSRAITERVFHDYQLLSVERTTALHDTEETAAPKEDPMIKSTCKPLAAALATLGPADSTAGSSAAGDTRGAKGGGSVGGGAEVSHPERQRRVQREMMSMIKRPHEAFEVFPSDENMFFWKALVNGPASTPYGGGCWMLSIFFPPSYPSVAPRVRFVTPIRHCNVNTHGRVCHAIFDRSWTPNTSVADVLACVYGLLLYPDHDDPLDSTLALQMYDSNGQYEAAIIEHVKAHASKPQRVWVTEMEAAAMSSEERLVTSLKTVQQAKAALAAGRLGDAKIQAETAVVFAVGGPAPITGFHTRRTNIDGRAHEAQLPGLQAARASALMVYARAELEEETPKLNVVEAVAEDARFFHCSSPEPSGCLAEVAKRNWKMCDPASKEGIKRLKKAIQHQKVHVGMLDGDVPARIAEAEKVLGELSEELKKYSNTAGRRTHLSFMDD